MQSRRRILTAAGAAIVASFTAAQSAQANTVLSGTATADNAFYAFVSTSPSVRGTLIGSGTDWTVGYPVMTSSLGPGVYYLQIEAINYGGPGGFSGVFSLNGNGKFSNGTQSLATDPAYLTDWLGGYNSSDGTVSMKTWVQPTGGVLQSTFPWGNKTGTPYWIWPSDSSSSPGGAGGACGTCTVDLMAQFFVRGQAAVPEPATWAMMLLGFGVVGWTWRRRPRAHTFFKTV